MLCKRADDGTVVQHNYCDINTMPSEQVRECNLEPCEPKWSIGSWQSCSATCGGGHRSRSVTCQRRLSATEDEIIDDKLCPGVKPEDRQSCSSEICPPQWVAKAWSKCNTKCGIGRKRREVVCMSSDKSETYDDDRCDARRKPPTSAKCHSGACPPPRWQVGQWAECSAKCGRGRQMRRVICLSHKRQRSSRCSPRNRPHNVRSCEAACPVDNEPPALPGTCEDDPKFAHCGLVQRFNFCNRAYFRKMCCNTCAELAG